MWIFCWKILWGAEKIIKGSLLSLHSNMAEFSCWNSQNEGWIFKSLSSSGTQAQSCRMLILFALLPEDPCNVFMDVQILSFSSTRIFSGWYFFFCSHCGEWEAAQSWVGRQNVPRFWISKNFQLGPEGTRCSGGCLGGTQLFSVGGSGWDNLGAFGFKIF